MRIIIISPLFIKPRKNSSKPLSEYGGCASNSVGRYLNNRERTQGTQLPFVEFPPRTKRALAS